jgi:hypothetical protein
MMMMQRMMMMTRRKKIMATMATITRMRRIENLY